MTSYSTLSPDLYAMLKRQANLRDALDRQIADIIRTRFPAADPHLRNVVCEELSLAVLECQLQITQCQDSYDETRQLDRLDEQVQA